jgi:peptidase M28-like protein
MAAGTRSLRAYEYHARRDTARVNARDEIAALTAFAGRGPGTDAERRAAEQLAGRLRSLNREARVEPVFVHPDWPGAHLLEALAAIVAGLLAVPLPLAGTVLAFAALILALGDLTGTLPAARLLTGRRASQNVVSAEDTGKPGTLVVVAHYDSPRGGPMFARAAALVEAVGRTARPRFGAAAVFVFCIAAIFVCAGLRLLGLESTVLAAVQFVPTAALVVAAAVLLDVRISPVSPGANDNASGVAVALGLADRLGGRLSEFDIWVLLTGAGEGTPQGARAWIRAHGDALPRDATVYLNVDAVGAGDPVFGRREGRLFPSAANSTLVELASEAAADRPELAARPAVLRRTGDAVAARDAGYPAMTITCLDRRDRVPNRRLATDMPDGVDDSSLQRALELCAELATRLDERVGPALGR